MVEALRHIPVPVSFFSIDGALILQNPRAEVLYSNTSLPNRVTKELPFSLPVPIMNNDNINNDSNQKRYDIGDFVFQGDIEMKTSSGDSIWHFMEIRLINDPITGTPALLCYEIDIREKRQLTEMRLAKEYAEEQRNLQSQFIAQVTHEIRTPLNGITGMLSLLQNSNLDPTQLELIDLLAISCHSLISVANNVLSMAQFEKNIIPRLSPFNVPKLIENTVITVYGKAQMKDIDIFWSISEDVPFHFNGSIELIKQSLLNLLGNAIKYSEANTKISVNAYLSGG